MWVLTCLFFFRVLGQAVQRWLPQDWLPPFDKWQGSSMPYGVLLSSQVIILCLMAIASHRAWSGRAQGRLRSARWLAGIGGIYMGLSLARLVVGASVASAPAWFTAWISGVFHVVLAAFLLAYAGYHYRKKPGPAASQ
jgi:hypothetical protein